MAVFFRSLRRRHDSRALRHTLEFSHPTRYGNYEELLARLQRVVDVLRLEVAAWLDVVEALLEEACIVFERTRHHAAVDVVEFVVVCPVWLNEDSFRINIFPMEKTAQKNSSFEGIRTRRAWGDLFLAQERG